MIGLYFNEFLNRRESEAVAGFSQALRCEHGVKEIAEYVAVSRQAFYRHDFYNLILRPLNYHHFLRTVVREQGRALGLLYLCRAEGEADFSPEDKKHCAGLLPFISHALAGSEDPQSLLVDSDEEGLVIVDLMGRIQHLSTGAYKLLYLVAHPVISVKGGVDLTGDPILPEGARQLCDRLVKMFAGQTVDTGSPVWHCRNRWGGFRFRAHWLNNYAPESAPLIGITIKPRSRCRSSCCASLSECPRCRAGRCKFVCCWRLLIPARP